MQYVNGSLLVVGGAGSGKSSLLAHKIAWLVREYGVPPAQILAISANARAAGALRAWVADRIGHQIPDLSVGTLSELGLSLIQERLDALGLRRGFSLYDRLDSEAVVGRLLRETRPQLLGLTAATARQIRHWKRDLITPPLPGEAPAASATDTAAWLYRLYEQRLRQANAIDIEDLTGKALELFSADASLLGAWRARMRFLIVDEYEQTTTAEHELVRVLAGAETLLVAAGDDNPCVANVGRASGGNVHRLQVELHGIRVIKLDRNFRSSARICRTAATLAAPRRHAVGQPAPGSADSGRHVVVMHARSEQHEADAVVSHLLEQKRRYNLDYRDFAVLLPRLELAAPMERVLRGHRVPYYVRGNGSFFDQIEVRDLWSYLRLLCNPADDTAFLRAINTPRRDIDRATLEQLLRFASDRRRPLLECTLDAELGRSVAPERFTTLHDVATLLQSFGERAVSADPVQLVHDLIDTLDYDEWLRDTCNDIKIAEDRMQNTLALVGRLRRLAKHHPGADLRSLAGKLALTALLEPDANESTAEGVAILPIAAAKGLEFAHVYLLGFEEGLLPGPGAERNMASERGRAYIAVSSARDSLTLTFAENRRLSGDLGPRRPSRFLAELPPEDLEWVATSPLSTRAEGVLSHAGNRPGSTVTRNYR